jgi:hypothetical protein
MTLKCQGSGFGQKAPLPLGHWQYEPMQWSWVTPVAVAVIGVGGSWLQVRRGRPRGREVLTQDLKVFKELPAESKARQRLLEHIDKEIIDIIESEDEKTRRPLGIILAIVFLGFAIFLFVEAVTLGGWWWSLILPAAITTIFGGVGLNLDAVPRKRNERGDAIREPKHKDPVESGQAQPSK